MKIVEVEKMTEKLTQNALTITQLEREIELRNAEREDSNAMQEELETYRSEISKVFR